MSIPCPLLLGTDFGCLCKCNELGFEMGLARWLDIILFKIIHQSGFQRTVTGSPAWVDSDDTLSLAVQPSLLEVGGQPDCCHMIQSEAAVETCCDSARSGQNLRPMPWFLTPKMLQHRVCERQNSALQASASLQDGGVLSQRQMHKLIINRGEWKSLQRGKKSARKLRFGGETEMLEMGKPSESNNTMIALLVVITKKRDCQGQRPKLMNLWSNVN